VIDVDSHLRRTGAILDGHFRLASGRHSGQYIEKFRIMEDTEATVALCSLIARHYADSGVSVVVGPAMGGVILAFETARQMGVRAIFAEKGPDNRLVFQRGFSVSPGDKVLVVDDVLTTGGSVRQVLELLQGLEADVCGIGFLIDRTDRGVDFGVPYYTCHSMSIESYDPSACPLCDKGLPLTET
jgi:orotate phosphoribosyltransferase